jgi:hypothetical protein
MAIGERLDLIKSFQGVFDAAAKERKKRQEMVPDPLEPDWKVFGWQLHEREQMHAAVNAERARRGLPPADITAIRRADGLAAGHVDYATKFPLYCAEVALGETPRP